MSNGKKDGLLSISASDRDPQVAADMANAYVDELLKLTQSLAISEAAQRRLFFEKQLRDTNANLANAEIAMRSTQEKTGMIQPEKQVQAIITALAQHKGAIAAKEVQLNAMRTFAAPGNPELRRVEEELRTMKGQLSRLEVNRVAGDGEFMVPSGRIPEVEVEYVRRLRDVKFHEAMFQLLAKQFEMAKIDEAKEAPIFQVLEKAVPAERKSKPRNGFIAVLCAVLGLVLAILFVLTRDLYRRWRADPDNATRWDGLMAALRPARQPKTPGRVPS